MSRKLGTVVRGIRGPIIQQGDDMAKIVSETILDTVESEKIDLHDRDIVCITESVVARSQGNYVTVDQIAKDINQKFSGDTLGLVFPILSRNRFSILLRAFARAKKKLVILLSYPNDEVGNELISMETLYHSGVNPYTEVFNEETFRHTFGSLLHPFTQMDYVQFYRELCEEESCVCEFVFANRAETILEYTKQVLCCDIHYRQLTVDRVKKAGGEVVLGLHDIVTSPVEEGAGYNSTYGLLGSNKASEEKVKLFPRPCQDLVEAVQTRILEKTGKKVEVMVYGDGAFKDPVGKIWELADPVVSPAYTSGLEGTPHELKLKYLADNDFAGLSSEEQAKAIKERILSKTAEETAGMVGQGTTPRRLTDLIGSLCDLTSGSGDKGTPFILIQGYFDHYAKEND